MSESVSTKFSIRKYTAVIAILIVLVMTVLDVTVVNVALPVMASKFGISDSYAVWIVTIYQLVITMLLLPMSSFGDRYSYRRCFMVGVTIFTLASAMCAASTNFALIIAARALQGIGAACVMGVNIALTRLIYPRNVLGRGLALNGMVIAISTAAGPTIAGAILSIASWHWLFLINVPFGIIAFFLGKKLLPQNPPREQTGKFDWISAVENMIVFGLIFIAIGNFARHGDLGLNIILLVAGLVTGYFYVRRQFGRPSPMLPIDLFKIKIYTLSIFTSVCSFIAQNVAMISIPFLFLNSYGFSEITTGLLMTPWPLATMIVTDGRPIRRAPQRRRNRRCRHGGLRSRGPAPPVRAHRNFRMEYRMAHGCLRRWFRTLPDPQQHRDGNVDPVHRTGGAGGMQSTARLVGQTLGATLVTIVFALTTSANSSAPVHVCLYIALGFAIMAGLFSVSRR